MLVSRPSAALLARLATLPQLSLPPAPARRYGPPLRACATASPPPFTPTDEKWMQLALEEAATAFAKGEVPIGAVLVHNGVAIARAHNLVEHTQDASAHAEMLCLRAAAAQLDSWRLLNSTLYCTVEPCPMCLAAANGFRVSRLVYGTTNARLGMPTLFPPTHNPPTQPPPIFFPFGLCLLRRVCHLFKSRWTQFWSHLCVCVCVSTQSPLNLS